MVKATVCKTDDTINLVHEFESHLCLSNKSMIIQNKKLFGYQCQALINTYKEEDLTFLNCYIQTDKVINCSSNVTFRYCIVNLGTSEGTWFNYEQQ